VGKPPKSKTPPASTASAQRKWKLGALLIALVLSAAIILIVRGRVEPPLAVADLGPPAWHHYEVVNAYPHDPTAFTQGLLFRDGYLFESTGQYGRSTLRRVRLETGEVLQQQPLAAQYFAEGLAAWDDRLIQITWQSGVGFVYNVASLALEDTFEYPGEGWGLTAADDRLVMSDGTPVLRFLDPQTLVETGRLRVTYDGQAIAGLNELEFVNGELYANVWQTDQIVIIDLETGRVGGVLDLRGLLPPADRARPVDVLNGIAYDATGDRLFVTGKLWPKLFEIRIDRG
jgi:glutaminyl-peptide cyclotransferase